MALLDILTQNEIISKCTDYPSWSKVIGTTPNQAILFLHGEDLTGGEQTDGEKIGWTDGGTGGSMNTPQCLTFLSSSILKMQIASW